MKINKKELMRTIKFTLFSISAGIIEITLFALLDHFTNWSYWPSYLIALIASVRASSSEFAVKLFAASAASVTGAR